MVDRQTYKLNNFDLLRLIAALQVVAYHSVEILQTNPPEIVKSLLRFSFLFPGVPIFFFISGFLISKSYESNSKLSEYFQNRVLRLYPGLIICVALSFILIYISGYMASTNTNVFDWGLLYLAKTSFVQFYNPDFMRGYGDGVLNGSLWTITVELQFYFLVPVIYLLFKLQGEGAHNFKLVMLIAVFLLINRMFTYIPAEYHNEVGYKLLRISFLPWFYMFLFGVFIQKNFAFFHKIIAGRFLPFFIIYCIIGYVCMKYEFALGNNINPVVYVFLVTLSLSFAYSFVDLSKRLLRGNDISYGTYIYHMPVVNFMLYNGYSGDIVKALYVFVITIALALISWIVIEKRSLSLKRHPLNPLNKS